MGKKKSRKSVGTAKQQTHDILGPIEALLAHKLGPGPSPTIYEPTEEAMARLGVIPLLFEKPHDYSGEFGSIAYDSWTEGPAVALRDIADGHVRRLRLRAGKVSLEIVAERTAGRWEFVARAFRGTTVVHDIVLQVGRKKLLSESGGFFRWTSKSVPRRIGLASLRRTYTFERVPW